MDPETAVKLGLKSVPFITENYDKVYDPVKDKTKQGLSKVKQMKERRNNRGGYESETESDYEYQRPRRSQTEVTRRRSREDDYRGGRGDIVEQRYAKGSGRARSVGRDDRYGRERRSRGSRRDYSDSESSLSPPRRERRKSLGERALQALGLGGATGVALSEKEKDKDYYRTRSQQRRNRSGTPSSDSEGYWVRKSSRSGPISNGSAGYSDDRTPARYKPAGYLQNGDNDYNNSNGQVARRDARSAVTERRRRGSSSSSSSSSEEVCSSSEDERRTKRMKGKEYLTAGLAAVATIHAAHGVYSSMEARDKRHMEVLKGEMTAEEARKKKNKARLQDAAAIGIAALGIKGAYSEWQEVQEHRHELAEQNRERQERHEKRVKKMEKARRKGGDTYSGSGRSKSEGPGNRS